MARIGILTRSLTRLLCEKENHGLQLLRKSSSLQTKTPSEESESDGDSHLIDEHDLPDHSVHTVSTEDDNSSHNAYSSSGPNFREAFETFEKREVDLDAARPRVDPRLSKVFRGYNAVDEGSWTINYSAVGWYKMKQIYGCYDEDDPNSDFVIPPRSLYMKILYDPILCTMDNFDYKFEKKQVDKTKAFQTLNVDMLHTYGPDLLCAHFVACFGGRVKFHGFKDWFDRSNYKTLPKQYAPEFVVEAVDLSGTPLFYEGMAFLMPLKHLKSLNLSNCTALDEWAIARLYPLRSSLVHLDLSGCERVSERAIITLWKFKNLRRLVLKNLDHIKNLPLIVMQLEETLPDCFIDGVDIEKEPDPDLGIPVDLLDKLLDTQLLSKAGNDVSKLEYEKWWGLVDSEFDADKFNYVWRGRPFHDDREDLKHDFIQNLGWIWRLMTVNYFGPARELPARRI